MQVLSLFFSHSVCCFVIRSRDLFFPLRVLNRDQQVSARPKHIVVICVSLELPGYTFFFQKFYQYFRILHVFKGGVPK